MKVTALLAAAAALVASAPAFAAPVSASFQNLASTPMNVTKVNACGTFSPTPTTVAAGATSPVSSTECGSAGSAAHVTYVNGSKQCVFHISTLYTLGNPILGTSGYWTPKASADATGGATCKVVSQDVSSVLTTGAFKAVFSMK